MEQRDAWSAAFDLLDAQKSGYVELGTVVAVLIRPGGGKPLDEAQAWEALRDCDTDNDGKLSKVDFLRFFAPGAEREAIIRDVAKPKPTLGQTLPEFRASGFTRSAISAGIVGAGPTVAPAVPSMSPPPGLPALPSQPAQPFVSAPASAETPSQFLSREGKALPFSMRLPPPTVRGLDDGALDWLAQRPSDGPIVIVSYRLKGVLEHVDALNTDEGRAAIQGKFAGSIYAPSDDDLRAGKGTRFARAMREADDEELKKKPVTPGKIYPLPLRAGSVLLDILVDAHSWPGAARPITHTTT